MTPEQVLGLAGPLLRPVIGERNVEDLVVREDDDWSGTPSLYIDVFLAPGTRPPDLDAWLKAKTVLSDKLVAAGELRFPYVRLRDRQEESEDMPDEAA